uniref:eIF4E-3 n=1 Tax=Amphidinium carterae TaxID=2961 RepID=A0A0X8CYJ5_AMPCA|nr:eIF4E-3 [Amphidinium carterae]|mmetsp:Transcript_53793/g.125760  ORF Transcript_53793/g.125760 Transcript_53793/m.125760 type:complete len:233 (+) Transcript_53793:77-775(+)
MAVEIGNPLPDGLGDTSERTDDADEGDVKDSTSLAPKHELQHHWCLWVHQRPGTQKDGAWGDTQRMVHEFGTVEDFWCMFHYSYPPSKLEHVDYSLFKKGVTPAWEDPAFKGGGRWVIKLEKVKAQSLDDLWLSLCLALIGEAFIDIGGTLVCGAIVSVRSRASKIALWLSQAKDEKKVMAIGREYRNVLASTPCLSDLATKELTFEDFKKQAVTFVLSRPQTQEATAGVFQ